MSKGRAIIDSRRVITTAIFGERNEIEPLTARYHQVASKLQSYWMTGSLIFGVPLPGRSTHLPSK
jgi:hypothetical protein